jgi:hypothetical protein
MIELGVLEQIIDDILPKVTWEHDRQMEGSRHARVWSIVAYVGRGADWRFVVVGFTAKGQRCYDGTASKGVTLVRLTPELAHKVFDHAAAVVA